MMFISKLKYKKTIIFAVILVVFICIFIIVKESSKPVKLENLKISYLFGYDKAMIVNQNDRGQKNSIDLKEQYIFDYTNPIKYNVDRNELYTPFYNVNPNICMKKVAVVNLDTMKVKDYNFKEKNFCTVVSTTASKKYLYVTSNLNGINTIVQVNLDNGNERRITSDKYIAMDISANEGKLLINTEKLIGKEETNLLIYDEESLKVEKEYNSSKNKTGYFSPILIDNKIYSIGEFSNDKEKKLRVTNYQTNEVEFVTLKAAYAKKITHKSDKLYISHNDPDFERYIKVISIYDLKTKKMSKLKTKYMSMYVQASGDELYSLEMSDQYKFIESEAILVKYDLKTGKVIEEIKTNKLMPEGTDMLGSFIVY